MTTIEELVNKSIDMLTNDRVDELHSLYRVLKRMVRLKIGLHLLQKCFSNYIRGQGKFLMEEKSTDNNNGPTVIQNPTVVVQVKPTNFLF